MALSAAEGTVHQATDRTVLCPTAVCWRCLPSPTIEDLRRKARVIAIAPQFELSTFILSLGRQLCRLLALPSPERPEGFMQQGQDSSDRAGLDQACELSHGYDGGGQPERQCG